MKKITTDSRAAEQGFKMAVCCCPGGDILTPQMMLGYKLTDKNGRRAPVTNRIAAPWGIANELHVQVFDKRILRWHYMTTGTLSARAFGSMLMYLVFFSVWPEAFHRWGPTSTIDSQSRMNGVTIKVNWEVYSRPFKGFSQPPQSFEYEDEWCHRGQSSFVGPRCRVSERV